MEHQKHSYKLTMHVRDDDNYRFDVEVFVNTFDLNEALRTAQSMCYKEYGWKGQLRSIETVEALTEIDKPES